MNSIKYFLIAILLFFRIQSVFSASININGLYVNTFGNPSNQAVIYIHGGPGFNSFSFEESSAQILADKGYFVVVYDQRGCGRSSKDEDQKVYTYQNSVNDLKNIMNQLNIIKPILIGHSFGGSIALKFIDRFPNSVSKILLVSAPVSMPQTFRAMINRSIQLNSIPTWDINEYYLKIKNLNQIKQVSDAFLGINAIYGIHENGLRYIPPELIGASFMQAMTNGSYTPHNPTVKSKSINDFLSQSSNKNLMSDLQIEPMNGFARNENYATFDLFEIVNKYRNLIYGIYGADDGLFDQRQLDQIKDTLPTNHFKLLENASHSIYIDQQDEFFQEFDQLSNEFSNGMTCKNLY